MSNDLEQFKSTLCTRPDKMRCFCTNIYERKSLWSLSSCHTHARWRNL